MKDSAIVEIVLDQLACCGIDSGLGALYQAHKVGHGKWGLARIQFRAERSRRSDDVSKESVLPRNGSQSREEGKEGNNDRAGGAHAA